MKKIIFVFLAFVAGLAIKSEAQENSPEKFGNTLNLGAGIGYYGYVGHTLPVGMINYEFNVAKNFTLAPFVGVYAYRKYYYWGNPDKPYGDPSYRLYSYRETAVPLGLKGSYYFDQLFHAGPKWDFYGAASVGFVVRNTVWESGYYGDTHVVKRASPLYLDAHVGAEYHMSPRAGLFLDLSTGVSTFGLAIHM